MHHFRVELHAEVAAALVGDGCEGRRIGPGHRPEAVRHGIDAVSVTHPHRVALTGLPQTLEERGRRRDLDVGAAELPGLRGAHAPAERLDHGLLAVANPEDGHAAAEDLRGDRRRRFGRHGIGAAGQDDGARRRFEPISGPVPGHDLAVDAVLAHAPGDQLGDLAPEVDDEDTFAHPSRFFRYSAICSARSSPSGQGKSQTASILARLASASSRRPSARKVSAW